MEEKGNPLINFLNKWLENSLASIHNELSKIPEIKKIKEELLEDFRSEKND